MIGRSSVVWLSLALVAGGVLFHTSYRVQSMGRELRTVNRQIVEQREAIHVLKAEWAFLNEPSRIERLARQHTEMKPMTPDQVGSALDAIPAKPAQAAPAEGPTGVRTPTAPAAPRRPTTQQAQAGAAR
jgi:cell division protein FtsL